MTMHRHFGSGNLMCLFAVVTTYGVITAACNQNAAVCNALPRCPSPSSIRIEICIGSFIICANRVNDINQLFDTPFRYGDSLAGRLQM